MSGNPQVNRSKHLDPLYKRTRVDYVLDLETTGMRSGYGTDRTQHIAQAALTKFREGRAKKVYSKFTDVLLPVMRRFERGEISEEDFVRQLLTGHKDTPVWSRDILSRTNVMRGILGRQIEETVKSIRGGDKLVKQADIAQKVMKRLDRGRSIGAWNYEFDFGVLKQAAYKAGFGRQFMDVFSKAAQEGRIVEMSKPVHQFMYEEARLNAILPPEQRSKLKLVHVGDLEKVARWEKDRLAAIGQLDKPLSSGEVGQLLTSHKGFHRYFNEGIKDVLGEGLEGDKATGTLMRFSEYEKWFKKYGPDWTRTMEAQGFLQGQMTPNIQYARGWRLSDILVPALFGKKAGGIGGHEAAADTVAAYRVANDVFGEYGRILDETYLKAGQIASKREHQAVLLEARSRWSEVLAQKHAEGQIAVRNVDELTEAMSELTLRDARRFVAAKFTGKDIRQSVQETAGQLHLVDSLDKAGRRALDLKGPQLDSIADVWPQFRGEIARGAKSVWESPFGKVAAVAGGVLLLDAIVGSDDAFKPEWSRNPPQEFYRDPTVTRGRIGDAIHSWVQANAGSSRTALGRTQAEMPVPDSAFQGSVGNRSAGYVDIMSQRYGPLEIKTFQKFGEGGPLPAQIAQTQNYLAGTGSKVGYTIYTNPSDPSDITISQIDAGSRRRYQREFTHRIQGLRSANTMWSRWGGIQGKRDGHFQSGFNAKAAADILAGVSTETVVARGGTLLEHMGDNLFSAGASGARAAKRMTGRQPISARPIATSSVESGIENYNEIGVFAAGIQVPGSPSSMGWKTTRGFVQPRFSAPYIAENLADAATAELRRIQQGAFFTSEFQGLRQPWNPRPHRGMPGLELATELAKTSLKSPHPVPVGLQNLEIFPGEILTGQMMRPGRHGNFRVMAIRPGPEFVRDHTIKNWIQFNKHDSGYVLGITEEFSEAFGKADTPGKEGLRKQFRQRVINSITKPEAGALIGWHNLDAPIQKELQQLGLTKATWDAYASRSNVLVHSLYGYLKANPHYTSLDEIELLLSGRSPGPASKMGETVLKEGQIAEAQRIYSRLAGAGRTLSPIQIAKILQPGGALSTVKKSTVPTINVLSTKNYKAFADPSLQALRLETGRVLYKELQQTYGLSIGEARELVTRTGLIESSELQYLNVEPPAGTTKAVAKQAENVRWWRRNPNLLGAFNFTPHEIPLDPSLGLSGKIKRGRVLWEGVMERLFGRPFALRGAITEIAHRKLGAAVKVVAKLDPPEKGITKWLYDVGTDWYKEGKAGLKSKIGRGLQHLGAATHFKMNIFGVGLSGWAASSLADKYKSYPLGFGIEFVKGVALYDAGFSYGQRKLQKIIGKGGMFKKGVPGLSKIPFIDVVAMMVILGIVDNIITPVMDKISMAIGIMDEPPPIDPTTAYYMGDLQGVDKRQYLSENGIQPGFRSNTTDFGSGGWQRPAPVDASFQTQYSNPIPLRARSRNAGLVQELGKRARGSRTRDRSGYAPPPMRGGAIAA